MAAVATMVVEILKAVVPLLIDAVAELMKDKTEEEVAALRKQPIKISVAFGGGEGETVKALAEVEAKLPDEG